MKRKLFYLALFSFVVFILFVTRLGAIITIEIIKMRVPGTLKSVVKGNLIDDIVLEDVAYQTNHLKLTAKKIVFSINLIKIFKKELKIPSFHFKDASFSLKSFSQKPIVLTNMSGSIQSIASKKLELNIQKLEGSWLNKPLSAHFNLKLKENNLNLIRFHLSLDKINFQATQNNSNNINWELSYEKSDLNHAKIKGFIQPNKLLSQWNGEIVNAYFSLPIIGFWNLAEPKKFLISSENIETEDLNFSQEDKITAKLSASWNLKQGLNALLEIPPFPIENPNINGKAAFTFKCNQKPKAPLLMNGELVFYPGIYTLTTPENKKHLLNYLGGNIYIEVDEKEAKANYSFKESNANQFKGHLLLPINSNKQNLHGNFTGKLDNLNLLYLFFPQISKLSSTFNFDGVISGNLAKPIITLDAISKNGSFYIPKQALLINNLNIHLAGNLNQNLQLSGSGKSGEGQFNFNGFVILSKKPEMNLKLSGRNIQIYNTQNTQITASPSITLNYFEKKLLIEGNVPLVNADIILKNNTTAAISKDVIILDSNEKTSFSTIKIIPRLYVTTENRLHFKGYGLDGIISGKINIEKRIDGLLAGSGRLTIKEGKYRFQGANYYIQRGYLLFPAGTLLNDPILDIYILQKRASEIQTNNDIGIYVQGTLQKPIFSPYSNANLKNSEILSRLGFGSTQTANTNETNQFTSQTAFVLAGTANPVIEQLQESFGLEEFNVESREIHKNFATQGATDTVLVLGKALSKKFYLQYLQSLLEPISTVRLKYFLTPQITVSTETGSEGLGGDLIFSLERD